MSIRPTMRRVEFQSATALASDRWQSVFCSARAVGFQSATALASDRWEVKYDPTWQHGVSIRDRSRERSIWGPWWHFVWTGCFNPRPLSRAIDLPGQRTPPQRQVSIRDRSRERSMRSNFRRRTRRKVSIRDRSRERSIRSLRRPCCCTLVSIRDRSRERSICGPTAWIGVGLGVSIRDRSRERSMRWLLSTQLSPKKFQSATALASDRFATSYRSQQDYSVSIRDRSRERSIRHETRLRLPSRVSIRDRSRERSICWFAWNDCICQVSIRDRSRERSIEGEKRYWQLSACFNPRPLSRAIDSCLVNIAGSLSCFNPRPLSRAIDTRSMAIQIRHLSFNPRPLSRAIDTLE